MKKLIQFLIAILFAINVYAQPSTISYQGVLTDAGGAVLTGNYAIRFDICSGINGVNSVWNETHNPVSVTNGLFQVELGSVTPFGSLNFSTPYWLEITVDPSGTNTTLSPRVAFNASNYSMAGKATSLQIASGAGAGKVLTSDAQGNGSWQDAGGGGSSTIAAYGYVFNLASPFDATIVGGADIIFSAHGPLSGVSHTFDNTTVTVLSAGVYKIEYNVSVTSVGSSQAQIALAVNGSVYPSTPIACPSAPGQYTGTACISLAAGDVLTLRNNSSVPITLRVTPAVSSQMNIIKLD